MTRTIKAAAIAEGAEVGIRFGVATAHCAIGVTGIYGNVTRTTEKAIEVTTLVTQQKVWFPRKALVSGLERDGFQFFALARWFNPDQRQMRAATHHTLSA